MSFIKIDRMRHFVNQHGLMYNLGQKNDTFPLWVIFTKQTAIKKFQQFFQNV